MPKKTSNFDNIDAAIKAIQDDGISQKSAAKKFGVARSTLQFRLKNPDKKNISCGPSTVLNTNEEETLVKWLLECSKKGFPRRREDLQDSVKKFLDEQERPSPFKNNLPGIGWYKAFLRRHPILSIRTSEHVTNASANVSEHDIKKWFNDIHSYLTEENLVDILNDGRRVFNGDETGFSLCPKTKCVLGPKGSKDIYEVAKGNDKENITVMFSFNAVGEMCHPMVIFKYKRVPQNILDSIPPNWGVGRSDTGWMKSEIFYEYISNIFYPFVVESGIQLPVILFVDGHKSHLTYHLSKLCLQLNIILIALYPNATRILQPADVAAFRPIKAGWKKGVFDWRNEHPGNAVTKNDFSPILDKVLKNTVRAEVLINGFRACGLFPWNVNNIDFKKCLGKNPNTEITAVVNNETDTGMLDYKQFSDIVGTETIDKFKDIKNVITNESLPEEFFVLYRLHEKLKNNEGTIHQVSNDAEQLFSDNSMPPSNEIISTTSDHIQPQEKSKSNPTPINNLELRKITENLVEVKKLSISPIESVLVWPLTPERKGTRITERVPFVISSHKWQTLYEEKDKKKRTSEEEKNDRKKKRLENIQAKKSKVPKNNLKKSNIVRDIFQASTSKNIQPERHLSEMLAHPLTIIESSDQEDGTVNEINESSLRPDVLYKTTGLCFACAYNCNDIDNGLECMFCNKLYHLKCLDPKEYCCLGSDDVLYICFKCQTNFNK